MSSALTARKTPALASAQPTEDTGLRTDIQALRALAVMAVLLFHLWPKRLPGGYIGVDIFFVISGYLITSHLLRELVTTRRIRVARFWARRARRLLPASLVVLLATSAGVILWVPRGLWDQFLGEVLAATFYVENWRLANDSVDYLAATNQASPVQHFWTLSVEEQFYLALPLLLLLGVVVFRRMRVRRAVAIVVIICTLGSFAYSVWLTAWSPSVSYFSTLTRAWEFGIGALVAYLPVAPRRARWPLTFLGLAGAAAAMVFYTGTTPFPGAAALLPVLATAAMIFAGTGTFLAVIGRFRPVALLGRVSYSAYLIHWPLIVLVPFITGHELRTLEKVAILAGTLVAAWLCTTYVEDPVRFSQRLLGGRRPRVVAAWTAGGMAVVIAVAGGAIAVNTVEVRAAAAQAAELTSELPACFGAAAIDPQLAPCENPDLDGVIVPAPADAKSDNDIRSECWSNARNPGFRACTLGPEDGYARHILAIGDSHNNTLIGAYELIAESYGWRIDVASHAGCYWTAEELQRPSPEATEACAAWREAAHEHISESTDLDAIVVTRSSGRRDASDSKVDGMVEAWSNRPDGTRLIALLDNPRLADDVAACVERDPSGSGEQCGLARAQATFDDGQARAAQQVEGAEVIDLTDYYCSADSCPAVIGGVLVYRDGHHLSATYASTLAPYLGRELREIVE